jgi:hypothetical protein
MNIKWLCLVSGILLLLGIPTGWPYSYYIFLRWAIFILSIYTTYVCYVSKLTVWTLILGGIALLFNPIMPIYLSKSTWVLLDFLSAVVFFIAIFSVKIIKQDENN